MASVRRDDGRVPGTDAALLAVEYQDGFAVHDIPHLLLGVMMLVQVGGTFGNLPVGEGHVLGVEEPARPARERRAPQHLSPIDERHQLPRSPPAPASVPGTTRSGPAT